jgi:uncharacterized protein YndB with AHSA1/START domain
MNRHELAIRRRIAASPETVYRVWSERMAEWWAPLPWTTPVVEMDLRSGGRSYFEMESPEGERFPHEGLFLEVVPARRVVITNLFGPGWVPRPASGEGCDFPSVSFFEFEPDGEGTRYTARVLHWKEEDMRAHEEMGFHEGWGQVADQLVAIVEEETARKAA